MLNINDLAKGLAAIEEAKRIVNIEMPNSTFKLDGIDGENIYFSVVVKSSQITKEQIESIKEKTRFVIIEENKNIVHTAKFSMSTEYNSSREYTEILNK